MSASQSSSQGGRTSKTAPLWAVVTVVILAVSVAAGVLLVWPSLSRSSTTTSQPPPVLINSTGLPANANLTAPTAPPVTLTGGRLGVDVRADVSLTSADASALNTTGVQLVRWPGGGLGDRFDPLGASDAGIIYNNDGSTAVPATSFGQFVIWCGWVHCKSIVTLPAEGDNASFAAAVVAYSSDILHFHPTYWEIGNEPEQWTHFGVPWTSWNSSQDVVSSPTQFATLVQGYVSAVRSVDPTTPIIGIGGIGAGGSQPAWISDDVTTNGPNLSGIAIHVYPSGTVSSPEPPANWFASLAGSSGLPGRVNTTVSSLTEECPLCNLSVFVDEFGSGTLVPVGDEIEGGYLAAYVSAELVQSLPLEAGTFAYYDLQSDTPGSWFSQSGSPSAAYFAYANWAERVGATAAPLGVDSGATGLLAAEGGANPADLTNLILVNINSTYSFTLNLSKNYPGLADARILGWSGSASVPSNLSWPSSGPVNFTLPPMSLAIFSQLGPGSFSAVGSIGGGHRVTSHFALASGAGWVLRPPLPWPVQAALGGPLPVGMGAATVTHRRLLAGAARWQ